MSHASQCAMILEHLKTYQSITVIEAEMYACKRLAARIDNLRKDNHDIRTVMIEGLNRFGEKCRFAKYVYYGVKHG